MLQEQLHTPLRMLLHKGAGLQQVLCDGCQPCVIVLNSPRKSQIVSSLENMALSGRYLYFNPLIKNIS